MNYLLAMIIAFSIVYFIIPILMKMSFKYNFTECKNCWLWDF